MGREAAVVGLRERCPMCRSEDVGTVEPDLFVLELERADEVRAGWAEVVEFHCRACGTAWD